MKVWEDQPDDKHFWAFYYFCKRKGDKVKVIKHKDNTNTLIIYETQ